MMARKPTDSGHLRKLLLSLAIVGVLMLLWVRGPEAWAGEFGLVGSQDFVEYWSAAQLLWDGQNPYDPVALLAAEQEAGWPEVEPLRMYNPPWALVPILPLALLPFPIATVVWLIAQTGLLIGSGLLLWRYFDRDDHGTWIGLLLVVLFAPGLFALRTGQISPWLLAGVAGFLCAERAKRDWLAGASLALLMIKPHIAYLFWPVALGWAWRGAKQRVLWGWIMSLGAATVFISIFVPSVVPDYLKVAQNPPLDWASSTLGTWLRLVFGVERRWLQYVPSLAGAALVIVWLFRRQGPWNWLRVTAPLLLASCATSTYGWSFDGVVLLPVVIDLVSRLRWAALPRRGAVLAVWGASQIALWALNLLRINDVFFVWHPFVLAGLYWWGTRGSPNPGANGRSAEARSTTT